MDELIKLVADKAGVSPDQAKVAVNTVMAYLKDKTPAPLAGQLDGLLSGGGGLPTDLAKGLGGLLDKK